MIKLTKADEGHRVLDIATGSGEPAFTAAHRVGPEGSVIVTVVAPQMLALATTDMESFPLDTENETL